MEQPYLGKNWSVNWQLLSGYEDDQIMSILNLNLRHIKIISTDAL